MKRFIIIAMLTAIMPLAAMAQHEEDTENGVVSLAGRKEILYSNPICSYRPVQTSIGTTMKDWIKHTIKIT